MKVAAAAGSELAWWRGHVRLERGVLDDRFRLSLRMLRFVEVVVSRCGRYRFDEAGVSDVRRVETRAVGVQVERAIGLKLHVSIDGSWNRDRLRKFVHALPLAGRSCRVRVGRVCVNGASIVQLHRWFDVGPVGGCAARRSAGPLRSAVWGGSLRSPAWCSRGSIW